MPIRLLAPIATAALASACASDPPTPAVAESLAGTSWELVQFQSMDDAQGTTRISDPSLYTVRFEADGRASFRLNCNRAHGSWAAAPASDMVSGRLRFGPLAGTRALCPPPSLDEKLLVDLAHVRGYLLRDGMLHMSLMADAGIYSWRRAPR